MADISLLFDVAGGGSLSGESGKLIFDQLTSIVNTINATPLKIKFQPDKSSLNAMRTEIQKITESFGSISIGDIHISAGDSTKKIADSISQITSNAQRATAAVGKITTSLNENKIASVIGENIEVSREKINNLILDFERLQGKFVDLSKKVYLDGDGTNVQDRVQSTIDKLRYYKENILSASTTQQDFNTILKAYNIRLNSIKTALTSNAEKLSRMKKADQENLKDTNALSKAIVTTNRAYKQATDAVQKYTAAKRGKSSNEYADLERAAAALNSLNSRLNSGTISQQEYVRETNRLKAAIQQSTAIIKANGEAHLSMSDKMKLVVQKFAQYITAAKVIQTAWRAMRQMVQASIELDSAFTQLKIVTGATNSEMEQFSETAINLSKNLGRSVVDVTKSIETFSRLGYNLPDASALAEYATILANTAAVSTEEATTGLTSIIKGYGMDVTDAEHIADILIEVGQKYAVSASEMMEAFEKSGAALNATNTSIEKSAGLIAAANASVQNASTVGTALKTVSARIRGSKTDLEELGEDTEDLADGFSKYAEEIQALTGFNIMVDGTTNQFKDLYDIMEGIAGVWDELSDTQQARISEILGGTRQLQIISSIIGNWEDATSAYATAMDSAGVATKANDTYMESAAAHINQFKASFEELSSDIASSKLITFFVDFANTVISAVDAFANLPLPTITASIAALLSLKGVGELINQFQFLIILRIEYAHEVFN